MSTIPEPIVRRTLAELLARWNHTYFELNRQQRHIFMRDYDDAVRAFLGARWPATEPSPEEVDAIIADAVRVIARITDECATAEGYRPRRSRSAA